jgi:hypothetical protein
MNLLLGHYTGQGIVVLFLAGARDFSLLHNALWCSIIYKSPYPIGKGGSCPRILRSELEAGYSAVYSIMPSLRMHKAFLHSPIRSTEIVCMCLYGSQNKQRLFPYKTLTGWFL